ncbi:44744_t:CDS:2 [Gigaspora margarita]|uniref:44744_t:CDS:1 n=1 Tax=Gigaspora margarita TaxID=4874 RepID=A0ABN7VAS4_GIGMA|nr:44744_t:CDS:2 [Gigaspora margarita]
MPILNLKNITIQERQDTNKKIYYLIIDKDTDNAYFCFSGANICEVEVEFETNERGNNKVVKIPKKEFLKELKERVEKKKISEEEIFITLESQKKPEIITEYKKVNLSKLTSED